MISSTSSDEEELLKIFKIDKKSLLTSEKRFYKNIDLANECNEFSRNNTNEVYSNNQELTSKIVFSKNTFILYYEKLFKKYLYSMFNAKEARATTFSSSKRPKIDDWNQFFTECLDLNLFTVFRENKKVFYQWNLINRNMTKILPLSMFVNKIEKELSENFSIENLELLFSEFKLSENEWKIILNNIEDSSRNIKSKISDGKSVYMLQKF